jgi:hypothetical protein
MMPMHTCWRLGICATISHHGHSDAAPLLREAQGRLGGALLLVLLLVALGVAMRPQAIQHCWRGPACIALWKQPCKAAT